MGSKVGKPHVAVISESLQQFLPKALWKPIKSKGLCGRIEILEAENDPTQVWWERLLYLSRSAWARFAYTAAAAPTIGLALICHDTPASWSPYQ